MDGPRYRIAVVDSRNPKLGKCLTMDGRVQACEHDEHRRHETLIHAAAQHLPGATPRRAMIVGGGDCMALREALKYPQVERVVVADDDDHLADVCEAHMSAAGLRDDERVTWVRAAPLPAVRSQPLLSFDLIVIDLKDRPGSYAQAAGDAGLYKEARMRLAHHGVLAVAGAAGGDAARDRALRDVFSHTRTVTFWSDATGRQERALLCADFVLGTPAVVAPKVHTRYFGKASDAPEVQKAEAPGPTKGV